MKILKNLFIAGLLSLSIMTTSYADTHVMYTVQNGDTYYKLSNQFNTDISTLMSINSKTNTLLYRGDLLKVNTIPQTITVSVNHKEIHPDVNPYLENDRTFVPIRFISEALDATIDWDSAHKVAVITDGTTQIKLPIGNNYAYVNGIKYPLDGTIHLYNNRTFVPLRFVSEILSCTVNWNESNYSVNIINDGQTVTAMQPINYSDDDLYWLSRIVEAEASGESYDGKLAVANVVINRKNNTYFPDTIEEVVFDANNGIQFTPVKNGTIYNSPSDDSVNAAKEALNGTNNIGDCLYFINPRKSAYSWVSNNRTFYESIGNHDFHL